MNKRILLTYHICFGMGNSSDYRTWEGPLRDNELAVLEPHLNGQTKDIDAALLEKYLPYFYKRVYNEIVQNATDSFLDNEDPEDWDCEDEMDDPKWAITDSFDLGLRKFDIL